MVGHAEAQRVLTHDQIRGALDRLAARAGLSLQSLDPTGGDRILAAGDVAWIACGRASEPDGACLSARA